MTETMLDRLMKAACEARIGHEKCQCLDREGMPEAGSVTADVTCLSEISWQVNAVLEVLGENITTPMMETFYREMGRGHLPDDFSPVLQRALQAMLAEILKD